MGLDTDDYVPGTFRVSRAIVPVMMERGQGHVVNMGPTSGIKADAQRTAYAASKFATHGLSELLCRDYSGKGIRVTERLCRLVVAHRIK